MNFHHAHPLRISHSHDVQGNHGPGEALYAYNILRK